MVKGSIQSQQVRIKLGVSEMALVEIPNSNLKQYYYNVIKELHNIRRDGISMTEHFYYDVQDCYERGLDVGECVDYLIEIKEKP